MSWIRHLLSGAILATLLVFGVVADHALLLAGKRSHGVTTGRVANPVGGLHTSVPYRQRSPSELTALISSEGLTAEASFTGHTARDRSVSRTEYRWPRGGIFSGNQTYPVRFRQPHLQFGNDRNRILDDIEDELTHWPTKVTRQKKILKALEPLWDQVGPVWQLRVGDFRVYYDVREEERIVIVRAVRRKPPHQTTEEIL